MSETQADRDQNQQYLEELRNDLRGDLEVIDAQGATLARATEESTTLLRRHEGVKQYLAGKLAQVEEALSAPHDAEPSENGKAEIVDLIGVRASGDKPGE